MIGANENVRKVCNENVRKVCSGRGERIRSAVLALLSCLVSATPSRAEDLAACARLYTTGKYDECAQVAAEAIKNGDRDEAWWLWQIRSLSTRGQLDDARQRIDEGLAKFPYGIRLRLLAYDVFRQTGDKTRSDSMLREIEQLANRASGLYYEAADRVALGRTALRLGKDPRQVLELFYDRVRKDRPDTKDVYIAAGELALEKHDESVAAQSFAEGVKRFPDDPDLLAGLAIAYANSDPKICEDSLHAALETNPAHVPSLLLLVDRAIDAERYGDAEELIDRVLAVNPGHPEAWAFRAVLAELAGDSNRVTESRDAALKTWATNPAVDSLIGRKLSQKYRFAEGSSHQRRALELDPDWMPARIQLAQDLLRLGDEDGWRLADAVLSRDRYDVMAFNLVTLRDNIANYRVLRDGQLMVRMEPREAELYGDRVLDLLKRARDTLCPKYGLEITEPVTVEIFPSQADFAVRTFGMPGGAGYLGVCFGKLVTANSPASQGESPTSWESVLWHEFCHVVTLQLTKNKMSRWLSEGISVYEERQADRAWGQGMNAEYRELILGGELVPVGQLSAAFLTARNGRALQFAYFESALVVEFLIERYGIEALRRILHDIANDVPTNGAIERETKLTIGEVEQAFSAFAQEHATSLAGETDFSRDELPIPGPGGAARTAEWLKDHPKNFWGTLQLGAQLVQERKFSEAKSVLLRAIELYPGYTGSDNPYMILAAVHRELKDSTAEQEVLRRLVGRDAHSAPPLLRLLELDAAVQDWQALWSDSFQLLGVQPLLPQTHRAMARSAEQLDRRADAITAYRRLLVMDPDDPAELHYRLARLLYAAGDETAKRHVLMALEEAPRYPEALRLLLEIERAKPAARSEPGN